MKFQVWLTINISFACQDFRKNCKTVCFDK